MPIFLVLNYVSVTNMRNFLYILFSPIQPILLSYILFLYQYMGTDEAVIFKFTSNSKHPLSHFNKLRIDYSWSDMFPNNKAYSKNIFFLITAVVYSAILFYSYSYFIHVQVIYSRLSWPWDIEQVKIYK